MDSGLQERARAGGESPQRKALSEEIELGIGTAGEKSESTNINSGHGFLKIPQAQEGIEHGAITPKHGGDVHLIGKFRRGNPTLVSNEGGSFQIQYRAAAVGMERSSQGMERRNGDGF